MRDQEVASLTRKYLDHQAGIWRLFIHLPYPSNTLSYQECWRSITLPQLKYSVLYQGNTHPQTIFDVEQICRELYKKNYSPVKHFSQTWKEYEVVKSIKLAFFFTHLAHIVTWSRWEVRRLIRVMTVHLKCFHFNRMVFFFFVESWIFNFILFFYWRDSWRI